MKLHPHIGICLASLMLAACDVHQFPHDDEPAPPPLRIVLDLDYSTELPLHTVVYYQDGNQQGSITNQSRSTPLYKIRHTVQLYSGTDESRSSWSRSGPVYTMTVYRELSQGLPTDIELDIPEGRYTAMVWTDYVPTDETALTFYHTADFTEIRHPDLSRYQGSTDFCDAFRGEVSFTVPDGTLIADNVQTIPVAMQRPLAKFTVIATDVEEFASRTSASKGGDSSRAFDMSDYYVRLVYTGFRPTAFNMFLNKPVDSATGVWFSSEIALHNEQEAHLAFDYVMVNGSEAKVDAAVQLLDRKDNVLTQSQAFRVPLVRSKHTEVRGKFLTSANSSGVQIETDFDGEYNILIK